MYDGARPADNSCSAEPAFRKQILYPLENWIPLWGVQSPNGVSFQEPRSRWFSEQLENQFLENATPEPGPCAETFPNRRDDQAQNEIDRDQSNKRIEYIQPGHDDASTCEVDADPGHSRSARLDNLSGETQLP